MNLPATTNVWTADTTMGVKNRMAICLVAEIRISLALKPIFDKACRYMGGHSQPTEQLHVRPTVDELEQDFNQLDEMRSAYLSGKQSPG